MVSRQLLKDTNLAQVLFFYEFLVSLFSKDKYDISPKYCDIS
jgi:hypothetical protein